MTLKGHNKNFPICNLTTNKHTHTYTRILRYWISHFAFGSDLFTHYSDIFSNVHTSLIMQIMKKSHYSLNIYFCVRKNFRYIIFPLTLTVNAIARYKQLKLFITIYILDQFHQKFNPF